MSGMCEHCGHDWTRHNQATGYLAGDSRRCDCGCYWTDPTPEPEPPPPSERDLLVGRIEDAIWTALEDQPEGYVDRDMDVVDMSHFDMTAVAAAVLAAFEAEQS